jgi:hypothetical protein
VSEMSREELRVVIDRAFARHRLGWGARALVALWCMVLIVWLVAVPAVAVWVAR